MQFTFHQFAKFSANTKLPHYQSVKHVLTYLKSKAIQAIILKLDPEKGIKFYMKANFAYRWNQAGLVLSRMGYVITYDNCTIIWVIWIKKEIALSTMEA